MTILVTCGIHEEWCTFAQGRLESMGLNRAITPDRSNLNAEELTEKMLAASGFGDQRSYREASPALGQAWQLAAADLMIANADQDAWGWAHPENLRFLEFWKTFDPNCRFVLVYCSPAEFVAREISSDELELDRLEELAKRWQDYHAEMLHFYHANNEISMLINIHNFEDTAQDIATLLADRLKLNATRLNQPAHLFQSALMDVIAERLVDRDVELSTLYSELENSADLPSNLTAHTRLSLTTRAHEELSEKRQQLENKTQALDQKARESEQFENEVQRIQDLLEAERQAKSELERQIQDELSYGKSEVERLKSEAHVPELLEKQLEQVREELHLYFNKYHELKTKVELGQVGAATNESINKATQVANIDLRSFFEGEGWHQAEDNGRWAGAALTSTLRIPDLTPGTYTVSARIVDVMALDILRDMSLSINGTRLNTRLQILSDMGGRLAPLRRAKAHASNIEKPLPATLTATIQPQHMSADGKNILGVLSPRAIQPPATHGFDDRQLSCCIERVTIHRVA